MTTTSAASSGVSPGAYFAFFFPADVAKNDSDCGRRAIKPVVAIVTVAGSRYGGYGGMISVSLGSLPRPEETRSMAWLHALGDADAGREKPRNRGENPVEPDFT